ncbi:DNA topoisomerase II [Invertebrate iridescent virus 22]|uniref:DNA topoisomerase 2 n=1 Tax=Invertebrate iridescent virus 22 TaxID=345198 RepID=W8W205_9VIRU|nr:DNA topoisomerase II [Invertebrate iridescent virus 22]CCV01991.1 DNA topoisomerase II [Invertebrate iridescent virus 22]
MMSTKPKLKYCIKNDIQHVLDCSDVYLGDTSSSIRKEYVYNCELNKIVSQNINISEALVRIFVEVLTNAVDNVERSKDTETCCKTIKVNLNLETGLTSVWNDGVVIPIIKNKNQVMDKNDSENIFLSKEDKINLKKLNELYIHSLIFGHLRSSSNYSNEEVRETSGKNGVGVKCTNIFSSYFCVTGVDPNHKLKLVQEWTNNMTKTQDPEITTCNVTRGYTEVKYIPDFKRFNLTKYPDEFLSIAKKLVIDVSSLLPEINVYFNGEKILIKNLNSYSRLYYDDDEPINTLSLKYKGSEVVIVGSENCAANLPISFVNGQITKDGGQHTQSWTKTVFSSILESLNKSKKDTKLSKGDISPYFQFFIHSRVNKPKFDGQNKNMLKNPKVESKLEKTQLNKILKWPVITIIKEKVLRSKEFLALKKIESTKRKAIPKVDGYDPANTFGLESSLIVCEGLSAKSYAVAGIQTGIFGKKGRNYFGILPLRGKFLNVKNVSLTKIGNNKVVSDLIKVFNLKFNLDYSLPQNFKTLNYGNLLILTDADKDGIHIKGLILNFFHELFPTLFKKEGFIMSMETPIVKIFQKKGKEDLLFYDENTFEEYRQQKSIKNFKYYKGLGTINPKDVSSFFGKKLVKYRCDSKGEKTINKVFGSENTNERKLWLNNFNPKESKYCLDTLPEECEKKNNVVISTINVKVSDFMEHEMIKFSYEDCKRSLGSCIDGLKESQRKVIYAIRKKFKSKGDFIKVAQLSGYVAEQTDYKHGEQNLCETIIKFAQDFVGTNNIALLEPDGQFGTRLEGGKDSAASRYIYTKPHKILKYIFREEDDPILNYTVEGEPIHFIPVIPLILINGSIGIGTGWSCFIPQYNPLELIDVICLKLLNKKNNGINNLCPFYKNFKGKIKACDGGVLKFLTYGKMKRLDENTIQVTELPIGMWTDKFKEHCYSLIEKGLLTQLINESTTENVNFTLKGLEDLSVLKLTSTLHTTNMVLFNHKSVITKYQTINDILDNYFDTRLHYYNLRKNYLLQKLKDDINLNENKYKFINKVVESDTFLKQKDKHIIDELENENFLKINDTFNYLLNIPIRGCTVNAVNCLKTTILKLKEDLIELEQLSVEQMWLNELNEVKEQLIDQSI